MRRTERGGGGEIEREGVEVDARNGRTAEKQEAEDRKRERKRKKERERERQHRSRSNIHARLSICAHRNREEYVSTQQTC